MKRVVLTGEISEKDRKLRIYNKTEMQQFCSKHPGKVTITIESIGREPSEAFKGLYRNKIVPDYQTNLYEIGVRKSLEDAEINLRKTYSMIPIKDDGEMKTIDEMNTVELTDYISHIKQLFAEYFQKIVEY